MLGTKQNITKVLQAHALTKKQLCEMLEASPVVVGTRVRITGLVNRPELNGQEGILLLFDREKGKYGVRLADGREILLKGECLSPCDVSTEQPETMTSKVLKDLQVPAEYENFRRSVINSVSTPPA